MHRTVLVLVCWALAAHGRRVKTSAESVQDDSSQEHLVPILQKLLDHSALAPAMIPPGLVAGSGHKASPDDASTLENPAGSRWIALDRALRDHAESHMSHASQFRQDMVDKLLAADDGSEGSAASVHSLLRSYAPELLSKFLPAGAELEGAKGFAADPTGVVEPTQPAAKIDGEQELPKDYVVTIGGHKSVGAVVPTLSAAEVEDEQELKDHPVQSNIQTPSGAVVPTLSAAEIEDEQEPLKDHMVKSHMHNPAGAVGAVVPTLSAAEIQDEQELLKDHPGKSRVRSPVVAVVPTQYAAETGESDSPDWDGVVLPTPSEDEVKAWQTLLNRGNMALQKRIMARRAAIRSALVLQVAHTAMQPAEAFENRLPPDEFMLKYKVPQSPGPAPKDIGIQSTGTNALKPCIDGKPHCFSSSPEVFEDFSDAEYGIPGWQVDPFKYDKSLAEAFSDVKDAVAAYKPGQRGIDGGGFRLVKAEITAEVAYVYAQFQAMRKGYIDDMEFGLRNGECNVRTSSRLGYTDAGVNAKRYEWFADALKSKGWKTTPLRRKGHESYFDENGLTDSAMTKVDV